MRLDRSKMLFLQLDIMEKFRKLTYKYPSLVCTAHQFMQASDKLKIPLFMIEASKRTMGETAKEILAVKHKNVKQFEKFSFSCWDDPKIKSALLEMKPKDIVLYGMEAHACVLLTTLDFLNAGFNVHVVVDGVSCINKLDRSVALHRMSQAGASMVTTAIFTKTNYKNLQT